MSMKKRIMAMLASVMLCVCTMAFLPGCGGTKAETGENILEINVVNLGYGIKWVEKVGKRFEELNEGVKVNVVPNTVRDTDAMLQAGPEVTTADLLIHEYSMHPNLVHQKLRDGTPLVADLTDLYDEVVEGESKTIKERIYPSIEKNYNYMGKDKYYAFPIINDTNGLYYNKGMFTEHNWAVPKTTDELIAIAKKIATDTDVDPFIWVPGYWNFVIPVWSAQYDGYETYNNFYSPTEDQKPSDANSVWNNTPGRLESLKVLNSIVNPSANTEKLNANGCVSAVFTDVQTRFLLEEAAMIPNGGWMETEMADEASDVDVSIMRMPVISSLGTKLGITDEVLSSIIDYVDGTTATAPSFTSSAGKTAEEVIDTVRTARGISSMSNAYCSPAIVPGFSDAIPLAKKFLAYCTTAEAQSIIYETSGVLPCVTSNTTLTAKNSYSSFKKTKLEVYNMEDYVPLQLVDMSHPFYFLMGYMPYSRQAYPAKVFGAQSSKDRMTPEKFIEEEIKYMDNSWESNWKRINGFLAELNEG